MRPNIFTVLLLVLIAALGSWTVGLGRTSMVPKVTATRQLTHNRSVKTNLASDGSSLYFTELSGENVVISKVPAGGGDVSRFPVTFPNGQLLDISPAHSALLAAEFKVGAGGDYPFWVYPLSGGPGQQLANVAGQEAVWSPDQQHILLVKGSSLFLSEANGANSKQLATVNGTPYYPRYSPDGQRVRFSVGDVNQNTSSIWELNSDGSGLHEFMPAWSGSASKCCGAWTPDGRYYIFQATDVLLGSNGDLFALAESSGASAAPARLTQGSISFSRPVPAADGKRVWAMGLDIRGAVVSYDPVSEKFVPFLSGISASDLDFSADGQWVAYISIPDGALWRCKIDGTEKKQLTFSGRAALPRWSPDGKQIAYVNVRKGKPWAIHLIPAEGGTSRPLVEETSTQIDINWSLDGSKIIFGRITQHKAEGLGIVSYDLKTHKLSTIPGSDALFSPRLSPDGHYIAALSGDLTKLMLYDTQAQKWAEWQTLASGALNYPVWAADSKSIYFDDLLSGEGAYCRAKVGENHYDHVFSQRGIERHLGPFGLWSGRAPNGSVLFVQEASTREIYELQVELP